MKIRPVGTEFFHADGQTDKLDMKKLIIGFRDVVKAAKNYCFTNKHSHITRPTPTLSRGGFREIRFGKK